MTTVEGQIGRTNPTKRRAELAKPAQRLEKVLLEAGRQSRRTAALHIEGEELAIDRTIGPHTPWIENLRFSVQLFRDRDPDRLEEVIARMRDLTMARNAYAEAVARWSEGLIMLCQGGRILSRSDRRLAEFH